MRIKARATRRAILEHAQALAKARALMAGSAQPPAPEARAALAAIGFAAVAALAAGAAAFGPGV